MLAPDPVGRTAVTAVVRVGPGDIIVDLGHPGRYAGVFVIVGYHAGL